MIANPSNPSGVLHPPELVRDIASWCTRHDLWLVSDEVHGALVYDAPPVSATSSVADPSRLIVVDGVSKVRAMTGWRVGWLLGPAEVVAAARRHTSSTITHVSTLTPRAALAALNNPSPAGVLPTYRSARDLLVRRLREVPGVRCPVPAGGMFAFPDVSSLLDGRRPATTADLAVWLLEDAHVAVVPGEVFGAKTHLRISFAVGHERLSEAADRLVQGLTQGGPTS